MWRRAPIARLDAEDDQMSTDGLVDPAMRIDALEERVEHLASSIVE
jgi:hypothetical protein